MTKSDNLNSITPSCLTIDWAINDLMALNCQLLVQSVASKLKLLKDRELSDSDMVNVDMILPVLIPTRAILFVSTIDLFVKTSDSVVIFSRAFVD